MCRVRPCDFKWFFRRYGWRQVPSPRPTEIWRFASPPELTENDGGPFLLDIPATFDLADYDLRVEEAIRWLSLRLGRSEADILDDITGASDDRHLRDLLRQMPQNQNAAKLLVSELVSTIRQAVAKVLFISSQRRQEVEDIIADTFLKFFQRLNRVAADVPIRQQIRRLAKDTAIDWLRQQNARKPLLDTTDLDLLIQDDVEEGDWADIEQLILQWGRETQEEQLAVLSLRYVEGEKVSDSVRLNLAYSFALAAVANRNSAPSQDDLSKSFSKRAIAIGDIFDATGKAFHNLSKQGRLTADLSAAEVWQRIWDWFDDNLPNVPGVNRWRKTLLIRVGATPNQQELDLSGPVQAVAGRERRRLDDLLNKAQDTIRDHFFDDCRED